MIHLRSLLLLLALTLPAAAADVVYPPGSRIGMAPPPGMTTSSGFFGYEDRDNNVGIILAALPAAAFPQIEQTFDAEALQKQGMTVEKREPLPLTLGKAFLITGHQDVEKTKLRKWLLVAAAPELTVLVTVQVPEAAAKIYPDELVRSALATLAVRATVPVDEQLSLLPFKVSELAGFKISAVLPGRAIILSDAAEATAAPTVEPHIIVAIAPGGPEQAGERENFARDVFASIPNLKDIRFNGSEALRIGGQPGHQIMANAKDPATGAEIAIVQWLRFGGGAYLHMVGVAPMDEWLKAYGRFREVRDGIEPR